MAITLKISVSYNLKELGCEFSSSFDIVWGSEEGGMLFLKIAVMFGIKKRKKNESKRKQRVPEFFHR